MYAENDSGHDLSHAENVIKASLRLCEAQGADENICYTVAAYHDCRLSEGRELHHTNSAGYLRGDKSLLKWFTESDIRLMAEAVEDHRASAEHKPRSLYGMIVADADREISADRMFSRVLAYGRSHFPELDDNAQMERCFEHCRTKYGQDGYMKFYLRDENSDPELIKLRRLMDDKEQFLKECAKYL